MANKGNQFLLVFTTVAKKTDAKKIAQKLVEKKLAACVSTLPLGESHYVWKDKLCTDKEFVLLIKTQNQIFTRLKKELIEIHPYDCPEIIGIPIEKISKPYGEWLKKTLRA